MVHALKEARRVLAPGGIMIDVRPLSIDASLEVIYEDGSDIAGMVDMSPGLSYDQDADRAIEIVTTDQIFTEMKREYFNFIYYWKTVRGMKEDIKEYWQGEVLISEETWQRARTLFKKRRPKTQIRVAIRMKLGVYIKNGGWGG